MTIHASDWNGLVLAGGRYKITAKLGEGGMGSVYRALDQNIDADVVIKVPRAAMMEDPDFAGRFTREIRSLVKLSHPHIVKVTDVGNLDGTPFAVMQFLPGGTLDDHRTIAPDGLPLPGDPRKIPRWLTAVAEALDYVHAQGYVHRDVKPGNILFDAEGHAFLSDFGVAKVLASSPETKATQTAMTGAGIVLGTPEYMAPELIMGEPFDGRVDQYALAITVYEILCGRRPFESDAKTKLFVLHTSKAPPHLTKWCPALPEGLSQAVLIGLAKNPNDRYRSCSALAAAVAAETQNAFASTEGRVRLKCKACGQTGSAPAADYARLKEAGKQVACPACKAPMEPTATDTGRSSRTPGSGVTQTFTAPGSGSQRTQPRATGAVSGGTSAHTVQKETSTSAQTSRPARGQTAAQYATDILPPKPSPSERSLAADRHQSKSVSGRAPVAAHDNRAESPFKTIVTSVRDHPEPSSRARRKKDPSPRKIPTWAIVVGGGVWTAAIVALGALLILPWKASDPPPALSPSSGPAPSVATAAAAANPTPPKPPESSAPSQPQASAETPGDLALKTDRRNTPAGDSIARAEQPAIGSSNTTPEPRAAGSAKAEAVSRFSPPAGESPRVAPAEAKPERKPEPIRFDSSLLARKPVKAKEKLDKIIASRGAHAGSVLVPAGMYELKRSRDDRTDGPRKYSVTERRFEASGPGARYYLISGVTSDVEIEPRVAAHLDELSAQQLENKPAILTLAIGESGNLGLVGVEILQNSYPRLRSGIVPDIEYETLAVSPEGSRRTKGDDKDWETERMHKLARHYKGLLRLQKQMFENLQMSQVQRMMGNMWSNVMREAAAADAQQRALQQRLGGR